MIQIKTSAPGIRMKCKMNNQKKKTSFFILQNFALFVHNLSWMFPFKTIMLAVLDSNEM